MVVKHRTGWGYETLVREVSDSLHLRRFCLIALGERVPDESTVRKLTRRLGGAVVDELTRLVIEKAARETRFRARAVRIDSTVVEADVRYPTDSGLTLDGAAGAGAGVAARDREGRQGVGRVVDRSRALGRRLRLISRTLARRTGERKAEVLALTEQAGRLLVEVDPRSASTGGRGAAACSRPWCAGEARRDRAARRDDRPRAAGRHADRAATRGRADRRPAGLDVRPRREADPQRQARQAQRVRLRGPDLRGHREHQTRRARVHPARRDGHRQPAGEHAAADHRQRARTGSDYAHARSRSTAASRPARPSRRSPA